MFEIPEFEIPGIEQMAAQRYARTTAPLEAARKANPEIDIFKAVSLVDWTRIASAAGIVQTTLPQKWSARYQWMCSSILKIPARAMRSTGSK